MSAFQPCWTQKAHVAMQVHRSRVAVNVLHLSVCSICLCDAQKVLEQIQQLASTADQLGMHDLRRPGSCGRPPSQPMSWKNCKALRMQQDFPN